MSEEIATGIPAEGTPEVPVQPAQELIDIDYFSKIELRVAVIESAVQLPKSKKLLKLQIDLGPLGKRQILSGIAHHHSPESLVGRKIVVIANLKPARLMGEESQGMLLAASTEDDSVLALLQPDVEIGAGARVR